MNARDKIMLPLHESYLNNLEGIIIIEEREVQLGNDLVGKCGVFCGACRLYVLTKCKGCLDLFARKETGCSLYKCVESKRIDTCGRCQEFPCLEHYGSAQVFSKRKLLDWKKREIIGR